ncbi:MAG TPA: aminotransferase class III-fold pyridoxal phosphate-dependent enzyme, partial [Elusimicrobiales bacterium]|nr:aminotransferase class III-fold pyridoxal phosphate-dependent enzyme [Elusimicrobiales bacterium]
MTEKLNLANSDRLYKEAWELIPGAMMGIRRPYNFVPGEYPTFFETAKGGKVIDADGNEYIDMLCAYGPIIIGHREKEIDNAVIRQIKDKGFCMSLVQSVQNDLAKKLRQLIPSCEKCVLVKTGSDATSTAIRVARGFTDKVKFDFGDVGKLFIDGGAGKVTNDDGAADATIKVNFDDFLK